MSITERIQEDEEDYEYLCELFGVYRVPFMDDFYNHYEELKNRLKEKLEYEQKINNQYS